MSRSLRSASATRRASFAGGEAAKPRWSSSVEVLRRPCRTISSALPALRDRRRTLSVTYGSSDETALKQAALHPRRRAKSAPLTRRDNLLQAPVYSDQLKRRVYPLERVPGVRPVVGGWLSDDGSESDGSSDDEWDEIVAEFDPDSYWSRKLRKVLIIKQIPIHLVNTAEKLDWLRKQFALMMGNRNGTNRKARPTTAQLERVLDRYEQKAATNSNQKQGSAKDDDSSKTDGTSGRRRRRRRDGKRFGLDAVHEDEESDSGNEGSGRKDAFSGPLGRRKKSTRNGNGNGDGCAKCAEDEVDSEDGDSAKNGTGMSHGGFPFDYGGDFSGISGRGNGDGKTDGSTAEEDQMRNLLDSKQNGSRKMSGSQSSLTSTRRNRGQMPTGIASLTGNDQSQAENSQGGRQRTHTDSTMDDGGQLGPNLSRMKIHTESDDTGLGDGSDNQGSRVLGQLGQLKKHGHLPPLQLSSHERGKGGGVDNGEGSTALGGVDNGEGSTALGRTRNDEEKSSSLIGPPPHVRPNRSEYSDEEDDYARNDDKLHGYRLGSREGNIDPFPTGDRWASTFPKLYGLGIGTTSPPFSSYFPLLAQARDHNEHYKKLAQNRPKSVQKTQKN
eukprot:m.190934 g.190934  ORF g.190934 m.190934 type:complete len:612 (+) comp39439_c2_seq3:1930-3765(+)